jgi:hypothetical protein
VDGLNSECQWEYRYCCRLVYEHLLLAHVVVKIRFLEQYNGIMAVVPYYIIQINIYLLDLLHRVAYFANSIIIT